MRASRWVVLGIGVLLVAGCEEEGGPASAGDPESPPVARFDASTTSDTASGITVVGTASPRASGSIGLRSGRGRTACVRPPAGLVSWWPGDGSPRDVAGDNDGHLLHGATFGPGFVTSGNGRAFAFDGVDAIVRVPDSDDLDPTGPPGFTVDAWALTNTRDGNGAVVGKGTPFGGEPYVMDVFREQWRGFVRIPSGPAIRIRTGVPLQTGVWTHLAFSWDGSAIRFYVDGRRIGSAHVSAIKTSDVFLGIGGRSEEGFRDEQLEQEFDGRIDEVEFFGRALSDAEIAALYHAGSAGKCKPGRLPGTPRDLGTLGGSESVAFGIDDRGRIVGASLTAGGERHAFLWTERGGMHDLGTLGGTESVAFGVNGRGDVVGASLTAGGERHAFLWTRRGGMHDLGTLGGGSSSASAINDRGQVVGWSRTAHGEIHPFVWTRAGGMVDLGTLGGAVSQALGNNDGGEVVGSGDAIGSVERAITWGRIRR